MKNPLFESDPSDTDERRRSRDDQTSPGGIGRGWTEAPESHLRRVRAGGLLTKLPFDAKGTPRVRFFRVAASDRELQWGDPADAASPTLGSRLLLHEVQSVARGHATRAFEAHARADPKRAGPPAECFSLVAKDADSCDLRGGDVDDAALWAGALETLCSRARRAHAVERMHTFGDPDARANGLRKTATAETPSPSAARAPASLGRGKPPPSPSSSSLPSSSLPSPALLDYRTGGGSGVDPNAGAEAASAFVPMASEPPLANEGHVALAVSAPETEDARFSGDAADRSGARRRETLNPLGAVSRFAHPPSRPPPLLADEPATREAAGFETQKEEKGVAGVPRRARTDAVSSSSTSSSTLFADYAPLTARTYVSGGGEDLVEAFSRSRHGRAKELDALFSRGVDPRARDANGLTLLHIAAQNNQRKTAKLVLKRTDYAVDPPSREILNQQTNAGQTALHYAFAYGYHDLARWLVSLGADDGVVNAHGLSCYEGLDPDEPAREALAAPEMLEMARRKRQERRAEARRPGTSVGTSRDGARRHDELDAPGWEPRGPRSDSAYGGSSNRSHDAYSVSSAGSVESPTGWDPRPPSIAHRGVPAVPMPSPPVALVASPVVQDPFAVWDPGRPGPGPGPGYPRAAGFAPPGPGELPSPPFAHAYPPSPYGGVVSGAHGVYGEFYGHSVHSMHSPYAYPPATGDPVAAARFAAAAAHRNRATAPPYGNAPYGNAGFFPAPGFRGDLFPEAGPGSQPGLGPRDPAGDAPRPPSPIMRGARRDPRDDDSSNLDTSSDEASGAGSARVTDERKPKAKAKPKAESSFSRAERDVSPRRKPARRRAGEARAAAALPAKRGGRGAADPDLDGRVAMRFAAMRRGGFHSSDSDDATSASEAERNRETSARRVRKTSDVRKGRWMTGKASSLGPEDTEDREDREDRASASSKSGSAREREEDRTKHADAVNGRRRVSTTVSERSVLPPRVASKVRLVLHAANVVDFEIVRDALLTGALGAGVADWSKTLRELCDAAVFPSAVDLVAIRQAYVDADTGAVRKARADAAGAADRFFLALLEVKRPAEKARALATREGFARALDAVVAHLDAVARSAARAAASARLERLAEVALALGDILRKEEAKDGANAKKAKEDAREAYAHFAPGGWRAGALARLAPPPASGEARRGGAAGSASTANLLRHLAKTVAAKSPDLLRVGEELRSPRGEEPERNDATRGETIFSANERDGDERNRSSLASASARLVALDAAVDAAAREAEASATGKDAAYGKKFARSLELFLEQARAGLRRARAAQAQAREAAEALSEKFGPAPPGANPGETLEAILSFVRAFETAAEETAAAKRARERERAKKPARE